MEHCRWEANEWNIQSAITAACIQCVILYWQLSIFIKAHGLEWNQSNSYERREEKNKINCFKTAPSFLTCTFLFICVGVK